MPPPPLFTIAAAVSIAALVALLVWAPSRSAAAPHVARAGCDRYAATWGRASGDGTFAHPYRSVPALLRALRPRETGCLEPGVYRGDVTLARGGVQGGEVTIESASPRERARLVGRLYVTRTAHDLVLRDLTLDGQNGDRLPSPTVNGVRIDFDEDEVTNEHTSICFDLGSTHYGIVHDIVIERSRIHDCGQLPATNLGHGIYVAVAYDTRIVDNYVYDNADRGVQLYPQARGTLVTHNVIEGNGEGVIFGGNSTQVSSDNRVVANIIADSRVRANVESSWVGRVGTGNAVIGNCLWRGAGGVFDLTASGRPRVAGNRIGDPKFVDAARHDYRLRAGSPCRGLGPRRQPVAP